MKINKDNVLEEVTRILKKMKCVFTYDDLLFEIMIGTETCYIQVELDDSMMDYDNVTIQFYDDPDDASFEIAEEIETIEDIEEYTEQVVTFTKQKVKLINKINNHIIAIQELCENSEPEIDYEKFITINYDFTEYK